jgi:hypothetical protein
VVSIVLAMAAQPVAHLYGRSDLTGQQVILTTVVSCIPALVFGHLLHLAVSHHRTGVAEPSNDTTPVARRPRSIPQRRSGTKAPLATDYVAPGPVTDPVVSSDPDSGDATLEDVTPDPDGEIATGSGDVDATKQFLTTAEAAIVASQARGSEISAACIRMWKSRNHLTPVVSEDGDKLYHRDDVLHTEAKLRRGATA